MRTREQNVGARIAYDTAYFVLPRRVHADIEEVQSEFEESPDVAAQYYFLHAAKSRAVVPNPDDVRAVRAHTGCLDRQDFIVIEYPRYPAVDLLAELPAGVPSFGISHVLAPYFSAVVVDRLSHEVRYFVLGQSPDADTTLRMVSPEMNANLGRGCAPELAEFLKLLRQRTAEV